MDDCGSRWLAATLEMLFERRPWSGAGRDSYQSLGYHWFSIGTHTMWALIRAVLTPVKLFLGYDVFVSYARSDGSKYVDDLVRRLESVVAPRADLHESTPGPTLPFSLIVAVALSRVLAIACTRGTLQSVHIDAEVKWFRRLSGGPVLPLEFEGVAASDAIWWHRITGLPTIVRDQDAFRITQCIGFWKRSRRLTAGLALLGLALAVVSYLGAQANARYAAFADVERASRSEITESQFGGPGVVRALLAVRSWRRSHNAAALGIISEMLPQFAAPLIAWKSPVHQITRIAIDRTGQLIAVTNGKIVSVLTRDGREIGSFPMPIPTESVRVAFTSQPGEVVALGEGWVCRELLSQWSTAPCTKLGVTGKALLSSDGEWIAVSEGGRITLLHADLTGESRTLTGEALCFFGDYLRTRTTLHAADAVVDYPLRTGVFELPPVKATAPPYAEACSHDLVVYSGTYMGTRARWIRSKPQGADDEWQVRWAVAGASFSADGSRMVVPDPTGAHLWARGSSGWEQSTHLPGADAVALSEHDEAVTANEDSEVTISDVSDSRLLARWSKTSPDARRSLAFDGRWRNVEERNGWAESLLGKAPDRYLSDDKHWEVNVHANRIDISDAEVGNRILRLARPGAVTTMAFASDGRSIAVEQGDQVLVWSLDPEEYVRQICERIGLYWVTATTMDFDSDTFRQICGVDVRSLTSRLRGR